MIKFIKIFTTIFIAIITGLSFIVFISIAATSHKISDDSRDNAETRAFLSLIVGVLIIISIWIPWKRIINKVFKTGDL
jgi:xanthine/uracil permease